jgi:hypothetical protein
MHSTALRSRVVISGIRSESTSRLRHPPGMRSRVEASRQLIENARAFRNAYLIKSIS